MKSPVVTYDAEANAIYIQLSEGEVSETLELSPTTYLDVDKGGSPIGFEILNANPSLLTDVSAHPEGTSLRDLLKSNAA